VNNFTNRHKPGQTEVKNVQHGRESFKTSVHRTTHTQCTR